MVAESAEIGTGLALWNTIEGLQLLRATQHLLKHAFVTRHHEIG